MKALLAILLFSVSLQAQWYRPNMTQPAAETKARQLWGNFGYALSYTVSGSSIYEVGFMNRRSDPSAPMYKVSMGSAYGSFDRAFQQVPFREYPTTPGNTLFIINRLYATRRPCQPASWLSGIDGAMYLANCEKTDVDSRVMETLMTLCSLDLDRCRTLMLNKGLWLAK